MHDYRFTSHKPEASQKITSIGKLPTYKGAYISLSYFCNTDICEYCYARSQRVDEIMSISNFEKMLGWLTSISDYPEIYIVGGEPTTIPNLDGYLDVVVENKMKATIYTNGAFNEKRCHTLVMHPGLREIAFHYEPLFFSVYKGFRERFKRNIGYSAQHIPTSLVYTISSPDFDYSDLLEIAALNNASVTWIFAAPTSGQTRFLSLDEMKRMGPRVQQFLLDAYSKNIKIAPDLAIPLCIFEKSFLDTFQDEFGLIKRCQPFAYIKPNMAIQFCTALPIYTSPSPNSASELMQIIQNHRKIDIDLKHRPTFPECKECELHLQQICQGGCMTYKIYAGNGIRPG